MKKILMVGFLDSPHFARWIEMVSSEGDFELVLFCSSPARHLNPNLAALIKDRARNVSISDYSPKLPWLSFMLDKLFLLGRTRRRLEKCISKGDFELIHFFEMQHSGYLFEGLNKRPKTLYAYSSYGSDIYWYQNSKRHARRMAKALGIVDLVFFECERDLSFMQQHAKPSCSFVKTVNSGGLKRRNTSLRKARHSILIKGYSNKWGMALWTLYSIHSLRNEIAKNGYKIVIYSCDYHVPMLALAWGAFSKLKVETFVKGSLSHAETMSLFETAQAHIALSRSDGIPSSTLESMRGGAIPIQSNSACMEDWIEDGVNGFLIPIDKYRVRAALSKIMSDEEFVEFARKRNDVLIRDRHSVASVSTQIRDAYAKLLESDWDRAN